MIAQGTFFKEFFFKKNIGDFTDQGIHGGSRISGKGVHMYKGVGDSLC